MRRLPLFALVLFAVPACENRAACPPGATCVAAPTPENEELTTPVALDPNRPQPPAPTAFEVSRTMERAPRP